MSSPDEEHERPAADDLEIRRPDLLDVLRLGTVRWWKQDKGYGRIAADDGEVLFAASGVRLVGQPQPDPEVDSAQPDSGAGQW